MMISILKVIFSVTELLNLMQRHGIRVKVNRDGLMINGECISSVANFEDNRCPLATSCEKRVALVDFLKVQKSRESYRPMNSHTQEYEAPEAYPTMSQNSEYLERKEEPRRDFIKPNNHDLFEGNINNSRGLFDEPEEEPIMGLFDEPDIFSSPEVQRRDSSQDDQFFDNNNDDYREDSRPLPRDKPYSANNQDYGVHNRSQQPFCSECGFDMNPTWNSCPNCGHKIIRRNTNNSDKLFF
ncbi:MAG: zinc ribbon domain-containing protein [Candidatus Heimdallarchaeota archaeon]